MKAAHHTRRHNPEGFDVNFQRRKNLKSHILTSSTQLGRLPRISPR